MDTTKCRLSSENPSRLNPRLQGLDGLRGLAAFIVVLHHGMIVSPTFANALSGGSTDGWAQILTLPPLHLLWAGSEAVIIFFVLSGFVLVLPFVNLRTSNRIWASYYAKRLTRLYLPVTASLLLAVASFAIIPHTALGGQSWWINNHTTKPNWTTFLTDVALLPGPSWTNSVLWSLRYEVIFSLILPIAVILVTKANRRVRILLTVATVIALLLSGLLAITAVSYMLYFLVGTLLAASREELFGIFDQLGKMSQFILSITGALLLLAGWWPLVGRSGFAAVLAAAGAAILVIVFGRSSGADRLGTSRIPRWLGLRSFSLYLVHEPIIVSVAFATERTNPLVILAISMPLIIISTEVFYRIVELPSLQLARMTAAAIRNA